MINWKELEKFIVPGKVCTLVILVDGKEIGAFSFNIETLAYKEVLESKPAEPVKIAEKPVEKKAEPKKAEPKKPDKNDKTGKHPEFNPVPAKLEDNEEQDEDDDDDDESPFIDNVTEEVNTKYGSTMAALTDKPMTRESVLASDTKIEEKKSQPTLSEEW